MRRRARMAIIVSIGAVVGCGGFLGFGSDDEEPAPKAVDDAASADGTLSSEGGSNIVVDASGGTDATAAADVVTADVFTKADAMTLGDGRVCVPSGVCSVSVFDCCTETEDVSASSCEGLCGVDICCF